MLKLKKVLLPLCIVFCPTVSAAAGSSFEAKVVRVVDGDTLQVLDDQKTNIRVRLYGIDAPESKQAWGQKAKQALSGAVASKTVTVVDHGMDVYGRLLGTVWLDGYDINASMVSSGHAWVYRYQGNAVVPEYQKFESSAQSNGAGLWADKEPVPPWEWRQQNNKNKKSSERPGESKHE